MRRFFYIADRLEDIREVERSLSELGIPATQYHVLSEDNASAHKTQVHEVASIFRQDVIHSALIGCGVGLFSASLILGLAFGMGWPTSDFGWTPFFIIALLALGFCTWEGAFLGMQMPNIHFRRFSGDLQNGKHVFFIDLDADQETLFERLIRWHPTLRAAGTGEATAGWLLKSQNGFQKAIKALP